MATVTIEKMGVLNCGWGICGFTSAMYAMYDVNAAARPRLINAPEPFSVLAEIKSYLKMLQAENKHDLIGEIEKFTQTFGKVGGVDFSQFSVAKYIQYIDKSAQKYIGKGDKVNDEIFGDGNFSIAMPPLAVKDYLARMWEFESSVESADVGGDAIVGVKNSKGGGGKPYNGLCHWVYRKGQNIHSWGKVFASLQAANADFTFCVAVKIKS